MYISQCAQILNIAYYPLFTPNCLFLVQVVRADIAQIVLFYEIAKLQKRIKYKREIICEIIRKRCIDL